MGNTGRAAEGAARGIPPDIIVGRNAVLEALRSGRGINRILLAEGRRDGSIGEIAALARERGIIVETVPRGAIERMAPGCRHQGVLAHVAPVAYWSVEDILQRAHDRGEPPFLLVADEVEDPHNLGALIRTADAAGVHGVLIPKRRSAPLSATVAKTSAGAIEHVPVAQIGNVARTLEELKKDGLWVAGADMAGDLSYDEADLSGALAIVVGSEGRGLSRLVRTSCDFLVRLPMVGQIGSLNVSVAGSILMYEAFRQRMRRGQSS